MDGSPPAGFRECSAGRIPRVRERSPALQWRRSSCSRLRSPPTMRTCRASGPTSNWRRTRPRSQRPRRLRAIPTPPARPMSTTAPARSPMPFSSVTLRAAPAGTPAVAVRSTGGAVTAIVGYAGLVPSNFGSALGYDAVSVDASATLLSRVADSAQRRLAEPSACGYVSIWPQCRCKPRRLGAR